MTHVFLHKGATKPDWWPDGLQMTMGLNCHPVSCMADEEGWCSRPTERKWHDRQRWKIFEAAYRCSIHTSTAPSRYPDRNPTVVKNEKLEGIRKGIGQKSTPTTANYFWYTPNWICESLAKKHPQEVVTGSVRSGETSRTAGWYIRTRFVVTVPFIEVDCRWKVDILAYWNYISPNSLLVVHKTQ